MIEFLNPERLWALLAIPALVGGYLALSSRIARRRGARTQLSLLVPKDRTWVRHLAVAMAIASLVASILGVCCGIGSIVGIVLGILAINQIKQTRQNGHGLAVAGIAVGAVTLVISLIWGITALNV